MTFPYGEVCDSEPYSLVKIPSSKRFVKAMTCGGVPTGLTQNVLNGDSNHHFNRIDDIIYFNPRALMNGDWQKTVATGNEKGSSFARA